MFQHTATRRWLLLTDDESIHTMQVSTHSHPKVAAIATVSVGDKDKVSTHSHPKVAAKKKNIICEITNVSTHSHPKVAAKMSYSIRLMMLKFQHTATRRWLPLLGVGSYFAQKVSTHSHPKVAAPQRA